MKKQSIENLAEELDIDLVQVSVHSTDCVECQQFQGKVFSLSGDSNEFPRLLGTPPFCKKCRHTLLPYVPDPAEDLMPLIILSSLPNLLIESHQEYEQTLSRIRRSLSVGADSIPIEDESTGMPSTTKGCVVLLFVLFWMYVIYAVVA